MEELEQKVMALTVPPQPPPTQAAIGPPLRPPAWFQEVRAQLTVQERTGTHFGERYDVACERDEVHIPFEQGGPEKTANPSMDDQAEYVSICGSELSAHSESSDDQDDEEDELQIAATGASGSEQLGGAGMHPVLQLGSLADCILRQAQTQTSRLGNLELDEEQLIKMASMCW